jgi:hypothetical protein
LWKTESDERGGVAARMLGLPSEFGMATKSLRENLKLNMYLQPGNKEFLFSKTENRKHERSKTRSVREVKKWAKKTEGQAETWGHIGMKKNGKKRRIHRM